MQNDERTRRIEEAARRLNLVFPRDYRWAPDGYNVPTNLELTDSGIVALLEWARTEYVQLDGGVGSNAQSWRIKVGAGSRHFSDTLADVLLLAVTEGAE